MRTPGDAQALEEALDMFEFDLKAAADHSPTQKDWAEAQEALDHSRSNVLDAITWAIEALDLTPTEILNIGQIIVHRPLRRAPGGGQ